MPRSNVVITGLGVVSSIGLGGDAFFDALLERRSGITSLANRTDEGAKPDESSRPEGLWIGGPIVNFDPKQYVRPRKALKVMCREIQTSYVASQMATEGAGLEELLPAAAEGQLKPSEIGTVFGSEMFYGPTSEMEDAVKGCILDDGSIDEPKFGVSAMKNIMPLWMLKYLPNMPACHVGIAANAHGPNNTLVLGDVSGPAATIEAASCIERDIAKVMIAAGVGSKINTTRMNYRADLPIPEVFDPLEMSSRPYDPESKGVVGGEGAAAVVLEQAAHADSRGAKPIARLISYARRFVPSQGMSVGVRSSELASPGNRGSMLAIQQAIEGALQDAGITADDLALIVGHGMGDPVMDGADKAALNATAPRVPVVAPIASLGHTGAASGSIELVTAALALARDTVPPTIQTETTAGVNLLDAPSKLEGTHALCVSHTSEGNAIAIVLAKS